MAETLREPVDPYAPPPRHKDRSGSLVRLAIVGALLGATVWGYSEFAGQPGTALNTAVEEPQRMAANEDAGYAVSPTEEFAPAPAAPTIDEPRAAPAPVSEVPPPSTTIGESGR